MWVLSSDASRCIDVIVYKRYNILELVSVTNKSVIKITIFVCSLHDSRQNAVPIFIV